MKEPSINTSADLPPEFLAYKSDLEECTIESGKKGILQLELEEDVRIKKTVIKKHYAKVPLFIQRALYLEESIPSMAYIYVISPSGGILQGDRYKIGIKLSNNAQANITTQGATRIYKMEKDYATQMIDIVVEEGCYCEYIPDQIIPYTNSRFYQLTNLKVHENATMIYSEILVPGRVASGEKFEYDICYIKTVATNHVVKLRFIDALKLMPKKDNFKARGIMENFSILGNVYILAKVEHAKYLKEEINSFVNNIRKIQGGASTLPDRHGVAVRLLGNTTEHVKEVVYEILNISRRTILGGSFSKMRKS
ncbi:MAG TPA: urease accessory protein UreD [Nitrososphaeraceae archaeon]|nr:urease accessory protein UreD [Nitrososphaeraceae archaeon]